LHYEGVIYGYDEDWAFGCFGGGGYVFGDVALGAGWGEGGCEDWN